MSSHSTQKRQRIKGNESDEDSDGDGPVLNTQRRRERRGIESNDDEDEVEDDAGGSKSSHPAIPLLDPSGNGTPSNGIARVRGADG